MLTKSWRKWSHKLIWRKGSDVEHYAIFASNQCKNKKEYQKLDRFLQSAGSEARVLSEFSDSSEKSCFPSAEKPTNAQSLSCIDSSYDHWSQFENKHQNMDTYLNSNSRAKWQIMMIVKSELAKNLDKRINSYTGWRTFQKLSINDSFEKWFRNLKTDLNTIPSCQGRLEKCPLQHPRAEPSSVH